jgi:hypothetical protein
MKRLAISLGFALAAAACTVSSEEDQLENAIRENLSNQGTVQEVELTRQDDNNMNGFVVMQDRSGRRGRLNCTAQRAEGTNFNWRCSPAIDESVLQEMENQIRQELSQQGTVVEVDMQRQNDDNHMTGHAKVRLADGTEVTAPCTAERDSTNVGTFNWRCEPEGSQAGTQ